ncbi:unnamed protein product [Rhizoctonia solani]|uniref:SnoaL-like domain-containing protein n=1 Tax=Rhizoctonia solani TaxID=456999 RepID=A0A8H3CPL3_9AGAM|nr:unnamed protein product [Rhizoctonia solani]
METAQLKVEPTELKQSFNDAIEEQELSNLISAYVFSHDKCFGSKAGRKDDLAWESLFDAAGVSELGPIGTHEGREGKMAWAQQALGGRGRGCQIRLFDTRVHLDESDSDLATGCSHATIDVFPDDESKLISIRGNYRWVFKKVDSVWKITHVKLSQCPEQEA